MQQSSSKGSLQPLYKTLPPSYSSWSKGGYWTLPPGLAKGVHVTKSEQLESFCGMVFQPEPGRVVQLWGYVLLLSRSSTTDKNGSKVKVTQSNMQRGEKMRSPQCKLSQATALAKPVELGPYNLQSDAASFTLRPPQTLSFVTMNELNLSLFKANHSTFHWISSPLTQEGFVPVFNPPFSCTLKFSSFSWINLSHL